MRNRVKEGEGLLSAGKPAEAYKYFSALNQSSPESKEVKSAYARAGLKLAQSFFVGGEIAKTRELLLAVVQLKPETPDLIYEVCKISGTRTVVSNKYYNSYPQFSPDGKWLLFASAREDTNRDSRIDQKDRAGIYLLNLQTRTEYRLVNEQYPNFQPQFSPDGKKVLYLSRPRVVSQEEVTALDKFNGLYLLDIESGRGVCLIPEQEYFEIKYPSFSPDGQQLIYVGKKSKIENGAVYLLNIASGQKIKVAGEHFDNNFPSFSPDGKKIIYVSWRMDTNRDGIIDFKDNALIYLKDLETQTEVRVRGEEYDDRYPLFSPDGKKIIYLSRRKDTNGDGVINLLDNAGIYVYSPEDQKEIQVVDDRYFNAFALWSPAGNTILYLSSQTPQEFRKPDFFANKGIFTVDLKTKKIKEIISACYFGSRFPTFSRDGTRIAYVAWSAHSNRGIFVTRLDYAYSWEEVESFVKENLC